MANWLNGLKTLILGKRGQHRPTRKQAAPKPRRIGLCVERLEDRLTPSAAVLDFNSATHTLLFTGGSNADNLTISLSAGKYTFKDTGSGVTINVTSAAAGLGFTGSGTNTVTGGTLPTGDAIAIAGSSLNDTINVQSIGNPTTVTGAAGVNTINVSSNAPTNTGNLNGIGAALTVTASNNGMDTLNASNFGAASGDSNVVVGSSTITGFAGATNNQTITYNTASGGVFTLVHLYGSNSPSLAEKFTINNPGAKFQLDSEAGPDTANVQSLSSGATINMTAGNHTINVGASGSLAGVNGALSINAGTGTSVLNVDDSNDTANHTNILVSGNTIQNFAGGTITYNAIGGRYSAVNLHGSQGTDSFTVTANSPALNLFGDATGGNTDSYTLKNNATINSITGNAAADTLTYDSTYTNAVSVGLGSANASGFTAASATGISGGFSGIDTLNANAGSGTLTGEDLASTWTVYASSSNSTYSDGSETLTFSGFSTLNAGSAGDTFNLQSGASGYTINGGAGADTLTGAADATLSSSSSTGFSGSADNSISFSAIDVLAGSGSLTGESTTSTWTLGSPSTYSDGSNTLDFSGFATLNGSGNDTLAGVASAALTGSSSGFSGDATAPAVAFNGMAVLQGTGAASLTGENVASTWTVYASSSDSTYSDGENSLTFSGFSTLNAGSAGDEFDLQSGASGYSINGGAGTDTLTGVSDPTIAGSGNSNGYGGTADNGISFTAIDALTGSGTFTGDNNDSTFTIDSTSTYNDGQTANSLSFSGFSTITGGSGDDFFTITEPGSDTVATLGTLDGGAGTNTLDATNVNFVQQIADGYNYTDFQNVIAGGTFYGPNTNSTYEWNGTDWLLNGVSIGTPTTIQAGTANDTFIVDANTTTSTNLLGGGGDDTFSIQSGAQALGAVDGGTGTNTLDIAGSVTLTGSENDGSEVGYAGTNANLGASGFVGISILNDTNATPDALSGESGAYGTWSVGESPAATSSYADNTGTGLDLTFSGYATLNAGAGDTFNLTTDPSTGFTINGGSGTDTLTGLSNGTLSSSNGNGFSGTADNVISFNGIDILDGSGSLTGENAANIWTVYASSSNSTYNDGAATLTFSGFTTLNAGNVGDEFDLQSGASGYTINGGTGTDTLTGVSDATLSSSSGGGFTGTADNSISFTAIDVLDGSGSLTNSEGTASTWTLGSPSTYFDGSNTLDFSGFTTLNGSGNDTLAGVYEATLTGSSTGFSGTADYSSIAFNGMSALDGTGSATLTNGEGTAGTWTLGSPSTFSDGSNTLDFSGFTTLNGSGNDTLGSVTDATVTGSSSGFSGTADSASITFTGMSTLDGNGSASLTNDEGYGITWTLGAPSTYFDGSNTLDFSGFTTLNGSGADTLANVADATLTGSPFGFSGSADSPSVSFTGMSTLDGNGSASLSNGEGTASTWTVYSSSETSYYSDGSATLTFTGFTTLNAGNAGDEFDLQSGAAGYAINGGTGFDTLTGVADAVLSTSSGSGFTGTADNSISFSAIDSLAGSGSLTGENTASTWTLGSPSTYFDGSNTLDFSGFTTLNGSGNDTLAGVYEATLTGSSTGFSGTADYTSIAFNGMSALDGTGSATLTNGEGTAGTWTLGAPSTYFDGSNTLDFSGFTTLNGSGNDTLGSVTDATVTGSSSGFSGTADSASITFTGMSTLDGNGSASLTNDEGYGITWTLGAPSTYFDGSNTLDFSGFTTLNGSGADTLANVADATLTGSPFGFSGSADSPSVSFTGMSTLDGNGSASLSNGEGTASTWTVYSSSETSYYSDGTAILTFTGFTTLNAGNAGDEFDLQSGAAGYAINGGTGFDTLTGVSDAVLSASSGSGFTGTADNSISFSAIDSLAGSGSLTGENTASTWTLGSPSTYFDGSNTLDFSGFTTLNGSGNDTLAGVYEATLTGSSTGFSGTADYSSIAFNGMSALDGTGSASLTNGEGTPSTWTLGSPSTYSDGSNTLTFSGFTTLNGSGSDTLGSVTDATVTGSSSGFSGTADSASITFTGMSTLDGNGSASLTNDEGYGITWTLGAPSTYFDGSNTLDFSGFTTLNGSGADTLANVADATLTGSPFGFSGSADSPSVSFTGMSTLEGTGSASLSNGEGTASTWTVYSSSETSYYSDGTATLTFTGFTTLNAGNAGDEFDLQSGAAGYTINGGTGTDTLTGVSDAVLSASSGSGFTGTADNSISFSAIDSLAGSGSLTGENTASTWTLGSPSTYFDGSNTLDFSGFTTLNGSGNDTLAGVYEATLTGSSTGFSGTADYSSIAFNGMSALDGTGSASLTNGEGTPSTWTLGSPSTYSDGSNTLTFSGFTTLNGSGSDTLGSVTDATVTGSSSGFSGTADSASITFTGMSTLDGNGSASLTNDEGYGITWTLGAPSTYFDGSNTLDFSGFTTLNGSGADTLANVADATLTGSPFGFSGSADSPSVSFTGMSTLEGTGSASLSNGEGTASTWTVYSSSETSYYSDGSATLTFTGFTTLNAGNAGDEFDLQSGAAGYTINGGTGTDTLTGVSDAVLSSSSGSGFSGTADNSISFTAIDVLDGTGSLSNNEGVSAVWTVYASSSNSTYSDGTATLTFSGFSTLNAGTAGDEFDLQTGASSYTINGGSGSDTLTGVSNPTLSSSDDTGFSGSADNSISFTAIDILDGTGSLSNNEGVSAVWTVYASSSNSTYNDGTATLTFSGFTTLNAGNAGDEFDLQSGASGYTINGGTGTDTLTGVADAILSSSDDTGFSGSADNSISFTAIDILDGTGSLSNNEGVSAVWTVYASSSNSTYNDGTATLTFSGFTTLNAGTAGDEFDLQTGASGYTINGGSGTDTLTGVSDATLNTSSDAGFSGTADNSISFTAIDVLDGSGSLTNNEGVSAVWTVDANPTYYDGANTLSFSGFDTLNGGTAGDTFYVTVASTALTLNGNGGAGDTFTIGITGSQDLATDGSLADVTATVTINGASDAILNVSDAADTTAVAWTITSTDIQSGTQGDIIYSGPNNINVYLGGPTDGNRNAVDVESLQSGANLLLQDQGNTDYQFAQVGQNLNALSGTSINVASSNISTDIVALNDQNNTNATEYDVSDTGVTFGVGSIYFLSGGPSAVIVYGGDAANTFNVIPSAATSFSLVDGSAGSSTLNYLASQVSGPAVNPYNDGIFSISDRNDYYQVVYYFDFDPSLVNID